MINFSLKQKTVVKAVSRPAYTQHKFLKTKRTKCKCMIAKYMRQSNHHTFKKTSKATTYQTNKTTSLTALCQMVNWLKPARLKSITT